MKFLVEAQLPPALAQWLREVGHEAQAVRDVGLRDAEDHVLWQHALSIGAIIVTKDEDFSLRSRLHANTPRILWLRIGNTSNRALREWLLPQLPKIVAHFEEGAPLVEIR